jgi:hypothetical protein
LNECPPRNYQGLPELDYPFHDKAVSVTTCGRICFKRRKINLSTVFAGQTVGIKQTDEHIWLVSFMYYDLGYFDDETCRLEPLPNPFGPRLLPSADVPTPNAGEPRASAPPKRRSERAASPTPPCATREKVLPMSSV